MNIILTCGHPYSGFEFAHQAFAAAGLHEARAARKEPIFPADLNKSICDAHDVNQGVAAFAQIAAGRVWEDQASDIILSNLDQDTWGWADLRGLRLLDFWKDLDPQTRFVLVYSSPEFAVGQMLRGRGESPEVIAESIDSWVSANTELLRYYNRNRGRCLLVNVLAPLYTPRLFVEQAGRFLTLNLKALPGDYATDRAATSAVATTLAKSLIDDDCEAMDLYRELESTADLAESTDGNAQIEARQARIEYGNLLARLAETTRAFQEQGSQLAEAEARGTLLAKEQSEQLAARDAEIAGLRQVEQSLQEQQQRVAELSERNSVLQAQLAETETERNSKVSEDELRKLQTRNNEIFEENELLLAQLHQVQEELERLFVIQEGGRQESATSTFLTRFWAEQQPKEIRIDLREAIEGDNWYYPEEDGRWAGPDSISSLRLPALREGRYDVILDIVDAMDQEIVADMRVTLNGKLLEFAGVWDGYQQMHCASFVSTDIPARPVWEFQFNFPKLISPSDRGSDDRRRLAMRLRALTLKSNGAND